MEEKEQIPQVQLDKTLHNLDHMDKTIIPKDLPTTLSLPSFIRIIDFHFSDEGNMKITHTDPFSHSTVSLNIDDPYGFGSLMPLQAHNYFEVFFVIQGHLTLEMEHQSVTLSAGDIMLLNRSIRSKMHYENSCVICAVSIASSYMREFPHIPGFSEFLRTSIGDFYNRNSNDKIDSIHEYLLFHALNQDRAREIISTHIHTIRKELQLRDKGAYLIIYAYLLRIAEVLLDTSLFQEEYVQLQTHSDSQLVDYIRNYAQENRRKITLKELSYNLHYSEQYISRVFLASTGESFHTYNQRIYLEEAQNQLINTKNTVSNITILLGFTNKTHFYNIFKDRYGMGPTEYRKRNKK